MPKILIVEDDKLLVKVYKTNFEVMGYQVDTAADGQSGWNKIKAGGYDVVLLGLMLPILSGLQILTLIKNEKTDVKNGPVIVLSNIEDAKTMEELKALGAAGYLLKSNVTPQSIVTEVGKYINNHPNVCPAQ